MRRSLLFLAFGCLADRPAAAQDQVLTKPAARLTHQFSVISGLRELPGGKVLVSDGIDNVLLRIDLATQRIDTIGRTGAGPGEYRSPDALFPLPDNGTLLVDLGNARLNIFDGAGRPRETIPIAQNRAGDAPGPVPLIIPRGTDKAGRIYFQPVGGGPRADSGVVIRWDRTKGKLDTLARVKLPAMIVKSSGPANNRRETQRQPPYPVQDSWAVGPDGQVLLIRAPAYRADWVTAAGAFVAGKPVKAAPVPIKDADKREYLAELAANGLSVRMENVNGRVSMAFSRGGQRQDKNEDDEIQAQEWPAAKPVATGFATVTPDGRALVERSVPAGSPRTYDVVSPAGEVVGRLTLPPFRRLIAVGAAGLYARYVDADGVSFLERYDWR